MSRPAATTVSQFVAMIVIGSGFWRRFIAGADQVHSSQSGSAQGQEKTSPAGAEERVDELSMEHSPGLAGRYRPRGCAWTHLGYFGRTRRVAQTEYRRQIGQMFGEVVSSPWENLRGGLVLGGEGLWKQPCAPSHKAGRAIVECQALTLYLRRLLIVDRRTGKTDSVARLPG